MINILITGAGGFVGKTLTEYLKDKEYSVFATRHSELDLLDVDKVSKYLKDNDIKIIIHCANVGGKRDSQHTDILDNNIQMFTNLEKNMTKDMKMIFFGSGAEYAKTRDLVNVKESDFGKYTPKDEYGLSKYRISELISKSSKNIVSLRIFGLFGKYEDSDVRFISGAIIANLNKQPISINKNVVFSYLYEDDFCEIIEWFINNDCKEKFINIVPDEKIDLVSIASIINSVSDYKSEVIVLNEGLNNEYSGDNERLLKSIGDFSFIKYEESIKSMYNYFNDNFAIKSFE